MNNFGIAHFSLFVIDAWKYIFKAIIFILAAFVNKIEVFLKILIQQISNIPLILHFSHIFPFNIVLEKYHGRYFFRLTYTFIWRSYFALHMIMLHIDGKV